MKKLIPFILFVMVGCAPMGPKFMDLEKTKGPPSTPPKWKVDGTTLEPINSNWTADFNSVYTSIDPDNMTGDDNDNNVLDPAIVINSMITASKATNYTIGTDAAREAYGGVVYATAAITITAPAVAAHQQYCVEVVGDHYRVNPLLYTVLRLMR
jgi:hypothetical protein